MKKIISLFCRNYDGDHLVRDEIVPGAEWVIAGEGIPTRKMDGTCCMVRDGKLYKRYDAKKGRNPPSGFEPAQDADETTGHQPGWLAVGDGPEDAVHRETYQAYVRSFGGLPDGTYELVGPKINGNPESFQSHALIFHGGYDKESVDDAPREFSALRDWFSEKDIEGIVWHHPDGRMVKIKAKDFGLKRYKAVAL